MHEITVNDIINVCNATLLCGDITTIINTYSKDTRTLLPGDLYIGIKGENFDGNVFCEKALELGAIGCITDADISSDILKKYDNKIILKVENSIVALQKLASYKRSLYNIPVIGITGSVGKTSTKDIVASIVSQKYKVLKTEGNLNNQIGLPLTLLKLKDHTAVVIEMGMGNLGEIHNLSSIARPTTAIITNVGTSHIGKLGSRENILNAKLEILDGLSEDGKLIINNDNDLLHEYYENISRADTGPAPTNSTQFVACSNNVIPFGIENESEITPQNIICNPNNSTYTAVINDSEYTINIPIGGKHFVYNSLAAICVGLELGIDVPSIISGIQNFSLTKNRMEIKETKDNITIVNDVYNASYDSIKAALEYINDFKGKRKIAVLGDMLELGEYSKELHEKVANEVVKNNIDILVTVGKEAHYIYEKAISLGFNTSNMFCFYNNADAIELLNDMLKPNDIVLLKASNGMKFIEILNGIYKD